jgi:predicted nucleic acid-binding protein
MKSEGAWFLEMDKTICRKAGRLSYSLRKKGRSIPLTDALIASLALKHQLKLWTKDAHFKGIPGLELKD